MLDQNTSMIVKRGIIQKFKSMINNSSAQPALAVSAGLSLSSSDSDAHAGETAPSASAPALSEYDKIIQGAMPCLVHPYEKERANQERIKELEQRGIVDLGNQAQASPSQDSTGGGASAGIFAEQIKPSTTENSKPRSDHTPP
jgi:hypothetical protein